MTECHFTSLSEMLAAAAYESDGLEVGAVENMLTRKRLQCHRAL